MGFENNDASWNSIDNELYEIDGYLDIVES